MSGDASEYLIGLVGESHYQRAIANCTEDEVAYLWREPSNPYDKLAIVCENRFGQTIGYVPAGNFLQRVLAVERQGASAKIQSLNSGSAMTGVVIAVTLDGTPVPERKFRRREAVADYRAGRATVKGSGSWLLLAIVIALLVWIFG